MDPFLGGYLITGMMISGLMLFNLYDDRHKLPKAVTVFDKICLVCLPIIFVIFLTVLWPLLLFTRNEE